MINVVTRIPWDLFKMLSTSTAVAEFNDMLFKVRRKHFNFIQKKSTRRSTLQMKTLQKSRHGMKNYKRNLERQCYRLTSYSYRFPPSGIHPLLQRDPVEKLFLWNALDIHILDALDWLNLCKHRWEYAELLHDSNKEEVKQLMFCLFGK